MMFNHFTVYFIELAVILKHERTIDHIFDSIIVDNPRDHSVRRKFSINMSTTSREEQARAMINMVRAQVHFLKCSFLGNHGKIGCWSLSPRTTGGPRCPNTSAGMSQPVIYAAEPRCRRTFIATIRNYFQSHVPCITSLVLTLDDRTLCMLHHKEM